MPDLALLGGALLAATAISAGSTSAALPLLTRYSDQQYVREDLPETHDSKAGTPSMGGIPMLGAAIITAAGLAHLNHALSIRLLLCFAVVIGFAVIGVMDDLSKLGDPKSKGILARYRIGAQVLLATAFVAAQFKWTPLTVPDCLWLGTAGWGTIPAIIIGVFTVVGSANAVNLTDGLDGLAAGLTAIAAVALGLVCTVMDCAGIAVWCMAVGGASAGFLLLNAKPAKVWMGDVGSLGLGAAIASVAVVARIEIIFAIIAAVFVIEALSVIVQVISFQSTGRRIFKMSPLHHHYELAGLSEQKIVTRFWLAGVGAAAIAMAAFACAITA